MDVFGERMPDYQETLLTHGVVVLPTAWTTDPTARAAARARMRRDINESPEFLNAKLITSARKPKQWMETLRLQLSSRSSLT